MDEVTTELLVPTAGRFLHLITPTDSSKCVIFKDVRL